MTHRSLLPDAVDAYLHNEAHTETPLSRRLREETAKLPMGMMQIGVDGVFVGSGIFKSGDPAKRANAIVQAVTHYQDAHILAEVSRNLGEPMVGISVSTLEEKELLAVRGW